MKIFFVRVTVVGVIVAVVGVIGVVDAVGVASIAGFVGVASVVSEVSEVGFVGVAGVAVGVVFVAVVGDQRFRRLYCSKVRFVAVINMPNLHDITCLRVNSEVVGDDHIVGREAEAQRWSRRGGTW